MEMNIPTCSLPHSVTPSPERVRIHTRAAVGWTKNYRTVLKAEGATGPIVIAGIPKSILSETTNDKPQREHRDHKIITVLSSLTKAGLLALLDQRAYVQTIEELVNVPLSLRGAVRLVWKCHPYFDHPRAIERLIRRHGTENIVLLQTGRSLEQHVAECDAAIATMHTAGCLYPLLLKKPFIFSNTSGYIHKSPYIPKHAVLSVVTERQQIWKRLEQALFDPDARSIILEENRRTLDELSPQPQTISDDEAARQIIHGIKEACSLGSNS
jgi:hypothetical protein